MSWDAQIELLKVQYRALKPRERDVRDEEAAEGRRRADIRIREIRQALADEFRRYREAGMPQYAIQEVIGTKDWGTLKQWRDLMNVQSPREIRQAIASENSPFGWADDFSTLTVRKDSQGVALEEHVVYDMSTNREIGGYWWPDTGTLEQNGLSAAYRQAKAQDPKNFRRFVSEEIQKQIDAGNITAPNEGETA